eukprot:7780459-Pyramimonas_sp.AAC.1
MAPVFGRGDGAVAQPEKLTRAQVEQGLPPVGALREPGGSQFLLRRCAPRARGSSSCRSRSGRRWSQSR